MKLLKQVFHLLKRIQSIHKLHTAGTMACSRYEYVKNYELNDSILPNVWIVIRVDGKSFHKFAMEHDFAKPNDTAALNIMNSAAITVMEEFRDIVIAYGQSDEYSFVFRKETQVFNRRAAKLISYVTSLFTSAYVMQWSKWLPQRTLKYPPYFDGRAVMYPSDQNMRDYLSWRQADVHINNLYNTAFWNLVLQSGMSNQQAEAELRGTVASEKNELLFSRYGINYNKLPVIFRKGTILLRKHITLPESISGKGNRQLIVPIYEDMIADKFWQTHSELLGKYTPGEFAFIEQTADVLLAKQFQKLNTEKINI